MLPATQRIYGLDIIRAIAILMVVQLHSYAFLKIPFFTLGDGVSLFFVLSGFLIGQILLKLINTTGFTKKELVNFWIKRWFRTLPAYFFIVSVLIIFHLFSGSSYRFLHNAAHYFFVQDTGFKSLYPESWSLKIEEWFYLVIPIVFFSSFRLIKANRNKIIISWIVFIIIAGTCLRTYTAAHITNRQDWLLTVRLSLFSRTDSIMYGMLGAFISYHKYPIWNNRKNLLFYTGLIIFLITIFNSNQQFNWFTQYFQISFESVGALLLLPKLSSIKKGKGVVFRFFTFVSTISYSIYLLNAKPFNILMGSARVKLFMNNTFGNYYVGVELIFYLLWCFLGAYVLYMCVEKPMMKIRDKIVFLRKEKNLRKVNHDVLLSVE